MRSGAPAMASFAVSLKSQDFFAITLISFIAVSTILGSSPVRGLASLVDERELDADFVIPSVFDRRVAPAVSRAVQETVERTGLSRLVESG